MTVSSLYAIDSELTRRTLLGLKGVSVAVENPQPNIQKYAQRFGLTKDQLQKDIEQRFTKAGITVLNQEKWLQTPGRPVLYVIVNTHEYEKYWYAYTIVVDLMQITTLETNPDIKTLASTWSINMAGIANIGTLNTIKDRREYTGRQVYRRVPVGKSERAEIGEISTGLWGLGQRV